jgi:dipeptidase E
MKLLLTSGGITNDTLAGELEQLAGKPFAELKIGFIPSAAFGDPSDDKSWLIKDLYRLVERGATVAVISLADLTPEEIAAQLEQVDVVFMGGGDTFYLSWLMQQKGLFELLPKLFETKVYAGISAGSMIATASLRTVSFSIRKPDVSDAELELLGPEGRSSARTLGLVDFLIRPHMNNEEKQDIMLDMVQRVVNETGIRVYALDDNSAVRVVGDEVTVVGEGMGHIIESIK